MNKIEDTIKIKHCNGKIRELTLGRRKKKRKGIEVRQDDVQIYKRKRRTNNNEKTPFLQICCMILKK